MGKKKQELTFEQALARLEKIVTEMEEGKMGLDKILSKFNEGMQLAGFCSRKLESAERKVEILVRKHDGARALEPFEESELEDEDEKTSQDE